MKYRRGLRPALELIDGIYKKARETTDENEKRRLNEKAFLMIQELKREEDDK